MAVIIVSRANFDDAVLRASTTRPVLVDFWAPWCGPCRALTPVLERLATELADRFTLAKLNTDDEPELATRFGIRGIPSCKLFVDGKVTDEFTGALPERAVRDFLDRALPSPVAALIADARALLVANDAQGALTKLDRALALQPEDEGAQLIRAEALFALDRVGDARAAMQQLEDASPHTGRHVRDERAFAALKARLTFANDADVDIDALARKANARDGDLVARLDYAKALAAKGQYEPALEALLAIVRADRKFGDDAARRTMLTIFEALPADSDLVRRYRRELSSALN